MTLASESQALVFMTKYQCCTALYEPVFMEPAFKLNHLQLVKGNYINWFRYNIFCLLPDL